MGQGKERLREGVTKTKRTTGGEVFNPLSATKQFLFSKEKKMQNALKRKIVYLEEF